MLKHKSETDRGVRHSLFTISIDNKHYLETVFKDMEKTSGIRNHLFINDACKKISKSYIDIASIPGRVWKFNLNEKAIPAVIFSLFGVKLPIITDLVMKQDLYTLYKELDSSRIDSISNNLLLLYRLSDKENFYNITGHGESSNIYSELFRINMSIVIKRIIYNLCNGYITHPLMADFDDMVNLCNVSDVKSQDELMMSVLLKIWSIRPSVILKSNVAGTCPSAEMYIEFNIGEYGFYDTNTTFKFTNDLLGMLIANNGKISCVPNRTYTGLVSDGTTSFNMFPQQMYNSTLLSTNGILIVSIPRIKSGIFCSDRSSMLITKYIEFSKYLNINNKTLELVSAVCYKPDLFSNTFSSGIKSAGTVSVVKTNQGWIRYDPDFCTSHTLQERYFETCTQESLHTVKEKFTDGIVYSDAFIIDEIEALTEINTYGTILIFAQNYDSYISSNCLW